MTVLVGKIDNIPDGFFDISIFDVAREQSIELTSDITDHYVEDNTTIQDHIALKPAMVTISGYQGELARITDSVGKVSVSISQRLKSAIGIQSLVQKLDLLNPFEPIMPTQVQQARQKISQAADAVDEYKAIMNKNINAAKNAYSQIKPNPSLQGGAPDKFKRQAEAYAKFSLLRDNKILCTVETPWATFTNMAIQTILTRQGEDSSYITDFSITFKKINESQSKLVKFDARQFQSTTRAQRSEMSELGKSQGSQQLESILYGLYAGK